MNSRVAQLASSCVRSIRNLRGTSNPKNSVNFAISVHSGFLVPAALSFCEAGPHAKTGRLMTKLLNLGANPLNLRAIPVLESLLD